MSEAGAPVPEGDAAYCEALAGDLVAYSRKHAAVGLGRPEEGSPLRPRSET